ncbi:uncharacterized protein N7473_011632 [Penicillium subrubescens]|uniref:Uncharacterized protein n=1 Tax=Penicillium subrubescens TaxID=1316194 RepID=A0A1Q5TMJ8_9EURO|nr:uncharacterized protein N7473_011632 [Penicillium subrubescens]KAJ5880579.1 hypothetical protein N7473_011632 [Penicillium subrubescens]OKP01447.1 hypothetical protein PENSUB_7437 [Penicillium subrubescens]
MADQATDPRRGRIVPRTTSLDIPTDTDMDTTNTDQDTTDTSNTESSVSAVTGRMMNLTVNTDIPAPGHFAIPPPRSASIKDTELRSKISMLQGPPDQVGPVMNLLYNVEALHQCISENPEAWPIAALDHAGLIGVRTLLTEAPPHLLALIRVCLPPMTSFGTPLRFPKGFNTSNTTYRP